MEKQKQGHTPGPWHVGGKGSASAKLERNDPPRVWGPDTAGVADICIRRQLGEGRSKEELANARLIAAAPELLDACEAFIDVLDDGRNNAPEARAYAPGAMTEVVAQIRAALAKARP